MGGMAQRLLELSVSLPTGPLLLAAIGLAAVAAKRKRLGWSLVGLGGGSLLLLSLPLVASWLLLSLEVEPFDPARFEPGPGDAIVVLGGDVELEAPEFGGPTLGALSLQRVRYAARVARRTGLPVLTTGGPVRRPPGAERAPTIGRLMSDVLEDELGVSVRWIEERSSNTHQNAVLAAEMLAPAGIRRVLLVTHAWHMPRARESFEAQGLEVVPAATGYCVRPRPEVSDFVPSTRALRLASFAVHEWVGRAWYALRYGGG